MPKKKKVNFAPHNLEEVTKAQIEDIKFLTSDLPEYQKKALEHILTDASNGQQIKFYEDIPYSSVMDVDGKIKGTNYMVQAASPNNDLATPWYQGKLPAYDFGNDSEFSQIYMPSVQDYSNVNHYNAKKPGPFKDVDKVVVMFMDKDGNPTQVMAGGITDISMETSGHYHGNTIYQLRIVNPAIEVMPKEAEKESGD